MRVFPEHFQKRLEHGLPRGVLIFGPEPLQKLECEEATRALARTVSYTEREVFDIQDTTEWERLLNVCNAPSLFADKRLMELRFSSPKLSATWIRSLATLFGTTLEGLFFLITANTIETAVQKSAPFMALEKVLLTTACWPIPRAKLPSWIQKRFLGVGFEATQESLNLLADATEGNLLATKQIIEKISLLHPKGSLTVEQVVSVLYENVQFTPFDLPHALLNGDLARTGRILRSLREGGVAPALIVWTIAKEVRLLRQTRLTRPALHDLMCRIQTLDAMAKGAQRGDFWLLALEVCLAIVSPTLSFTPRGKAYA